MAEHLPHRVTFFTRVGCTLCDKALPLVRRTCAELGLGLVVTDIDADGKDDRLVQQFGNWVPVLAVDGRVRLRGILNPAWVKRELRAAAQGSPDKRSLRVAVVVLVDEMGRMLVNQRPMGSYYGGWWEWPGGKCEIGESPLACARRELAEEIGLTCSDLRLWKRVVHDYPDRVVRLHVFRGRPDAGSCPKPDALKHQWLLPEAVRKLPFLEANRPLLEELCGLGEA